MAGFSAGLLIALKYCGSFNSSNSTSSKGPLSVKVGTKPGAVCFAKPELLRVILAPLAVFCVRDL